MLLVVRRPSTVDHEMHEGTFVKLAAIAMGLVLFSFIIMGMSRLVVSAESARLLSAPTMLGGGGLVVFLTVRSVLAVSGIRPLDK